MLTVFLAATVLAAIFLAHCAFVGGAVRRGVFGRTPRVNGVYFSAGGTGGQALHVFYGICLGMVVNTAALFVLGMVGLLALPAVVLTGLALLSVAALMQRLAGHRIGGFYGCSRSDGLTGENGQGPSDPGPFVGRTETWLQLATLGVILLLCVAVSMHPPGHWDDTMYQLPLARHYVEHQTIVLHEYVRFPLFPQNMNLLFALGLMLGDTFSPIATHADELWRFGAPEVFAQLFATLPLFVIALGMWGASLRYMNSGVPGLLAALTLFMIGPVKSTLGFAYVDNGLAMYCWAAALAVAGMVGVRAPLTWRPAIGPAALLAGLLAGAACGTKYFGVVFSTWLGVLVFVAAWLAVQGNTPDADSGRSPIVAALKAAVAYAFGVLLVGSAWYIRSSVISGDPAHPAGASIFGFFLWNEGDLAFQYAEQGGYGVGVNPFKLPAALYEAGALLWLPAVASVFLKRVPAPVRLLQAAFLGYLAFWFVVSQVPRYLGPVYGLGGFLTFYALYRAWQFAVKRRFNWVSAVVMIIALAYTADRGIKYGSEYLRAEEVLATNSGYALYQRANAYSAEYGGRLIQVGFESGGYFFLGTVIGDWFGPGRYRDILKCDSLPCWLPNAAELEAVLKRHKAGMLLLNRQNVADLNEAELQAAGWQILVATENGVLFAPPRAAGHSSSSSP